jgi:hypothetical protein
MRDSETKDTSAFSIDMRQMTDHIRQSKTFAWISPISTPAASPAAAYLVRVYRPIVDTRLDQRPATCVVVGKECNARTREVVARSAPSAGRADGCNVRDT